MQRTQDNFQVVQGFFTSLERRDHDAALAAFDEHATWDTPAGGPFAGRFFGRAGIGRFLKLLAVAHPDGHIVTDLRLYAESDRVFAEFVWAPLSDSAPRVATSSLAVFQIVFNKITAVREFESAPVGG